MKAIIKNTCDAFKVKKGEEVVTKIYKQSDVYETAQS